MAWESLIGEIASGPVLGGLLIAGPGWRFVFFSTAPFALAGLLLVERRARRPASIGIAIIAAGTAIKPYLAAWAPAIAGYAGLWTLAVFAVVAAIPRDQQPNRPRLAIHHNAGITGRVTGIVPHDLLPAPRLTGIGRAL